MHKYIQLISYPLLFPFPVAAFLETRGREDGRTEGVAMWKPGRFVCFRLWRCEDGYFRGLVWLCCVRGIVGLVLWGGLRFEWGRKGEEGGKRVVSGVGDVGVEGRGRCEEEISMTSVGNGILACRFRVFDAI